MGRAGPMGASSTALRTRSVSVVGVFFGFQHGGFLLAKMVIGFKKSRPSWKEEIWFSGFFWTRKGCFEGVLFGCVAKGIDRLDGFDRSQSGQLVTSLCVRRSYSSDFDFLRATIQNGNFGSRTFLCAEK